MEVKKQTATLLGTFYLAHLTSPTVKIIIEFQKLVSINKLTLTSLSDARMLFLENNRICGICIIMAQTNTYLIENYFSRYPQPGVQFCTGFLQVQ